MTEISYDDVNIQNMSCVGKKHGYDCSTCLLKSWCDGIPKKNS